MLLPSTYANAKPVTVFGPNCIAFVFAYERSNYSAATFANCDSVTISDSISLEVAYSGAVAVAFSLAYAISNGDANTKSNPYS